MKFLMDNWALMGIFLASASMLLWPVLTGGIGLGALPVSAAVNLINRDKAVIVDLSDVAQFAAGHIRGAKHVTWAELEHKLPTLVKNKSLPIIFVAATDAYATRASVLAKKMGYERAQYLGGGIKAWKKADLPLDKQK